MSDYTPTTEDLAHALGDWAYKTGHPDNENRPEMLADDGETMLARFLAARDAEVAAKALEEAAMRADSDWGEFAYIDANGLITYGTVPEMLNERAAELRKAAEQ